MSKCCPNVQMLWGNLPCSGSDWVNYLTVNILRKTRLFISIQRDEIRIYVASK